MRHRRRVAVIAVSVALIAWQLRSTATTSLQAELPTVMPPGAAADRLIVEPDAGIAPIDDLLATPRQSLDLTMYELVDARAETVLADDAARGVRVRVVLDHRLEGTRNRAAYGYLTSRGVSVHWASSRFFVTHEKTFVIDQQAAVVMSLNLTDRYYATSRDVAVVDRDRRDVAAIESVFEADFAGRAVGTPPGDDLVWSPGQSDADVLALIASARHSIALESEELSSPRVIAALVAAARRGVSVSVAMTYDEAALPGLRAVEVAGGHVRVMYGETPLYVHAKLFAIDPGMPTQRAFVGSENLSDASLLHDRELGIVLLQPDLVHQIASVIDTDLQSGQPLTP